MKVKQELEKRFIQITIVYRALVFLFSLLNHPNNRGAGFRTLIAIPWWMVNKFFIRVPCIVEIIPGVKCICYPGKSLYSALVFYTRLPEYGEMRLLLHSLKKDDVFIDVGANIGVYSLLAASRIVNGQVYAFEPSILSLPRLRSNIELNNFENKITVVDKIVADKVGFKYFDIGNEPDYNHIAISKEGKLVKKIRSITLDRFILENRLKHVRAVKIDVEGAEPLVLKGLARSLKQGIIDFLVVEVSDWTYRRFDDSPEYLVNDLEKFGYSIYYFDSFQRLVKFEWALGKAINLIAIHKDKINEIMGNKRI